MILAIIRKYSVILIRTHVQYTSFQHSPKFFYSQKNTSSTYLEIQIWTSYIKCPRHLATHYKIYDKSLAIDRLMEERRIILKKKNKMRSWVIHSPNTGTVFYEMNDDSRIFAERKKERERKWWHHVAATRMLEELDYRVCIFKTTILHRHCDCLAFFSSIVLIFIYIYRAFYSFFH
jgi:hypothetical protein